MSKYKIQVSNCELDVLKFIWRHEPASSRLIVHEMKACNNWHPSTSKTLIRRLLDKKVITYDIIKSQRCYTSTITKQDFLQMEFERILSGFDKENITEINNHLVRPINSNDNGGSNDNKI